MSVFILALTQRDVLRVHTLLRGSAVGFSGLAISDIGIAFRNLSFGTSVFVATFVVRSPQISSIGYSSRVKADLIGRQ